MVNEVTTPYHVQRREFLSEDPIRGEFIVATVQDTREISDEDESWKWGMVQLEICDGYRWIGFDFEMRDHSERLNSLAKINLLAEVINQMREAIELEVESRDARPHVLYLSEASVA